MDIAVHVLLLGKLDFQGIYLVQALASAFLESPPAIVSLEVQ